MNKKDNEHDVDKIDLYNCQKKIDFLSSKMAHKLVKSHFKNI